MIQHSTLLGLPYIQAAQAQKHVIHNEALRLLDLLVQPAVMDRDRTVPPEAPSEGDRHLVAVGAEGGWAGHDNEIALFETGVWIFHVPRPGWRVEVLADGGAAVFDGAGWRSGPRMLGVSVEADATNRLAVSAPATLLTHDGAGHQLKVNKATAADTGSLLFQTGWSGRAEMGCAGNDGFSIKVSADGAAWTEALSFDPATGLATGAAVQRDGADRTPGRLARVENVYGPANLLGEVAEAGGQPTGAVIERGEDARGEFVRFADGTQICTREVEVDVASTDYQAFAFPRPFLRPPSASLSHADPMPNAALELANLRSLSTRADPSQEWGLVLKAAGVAAGGSADRLRLQAVGRWF
jgi:hypothetical protein